MSAGRVRTVFGVPLYNGADHLAEALESLLTQTRGDLAIALVDDRSTDTTREVAERYVALDHRVSYHRNETRLGLARNWQAAYERATRSFPEADLFAWGSDHDVWHPRWHELLAAALDERPGAVLAFPDVAMLEQGSLLRPLSTTLDTVGLRGDAAVIDRVIRGGLSRGNMVYGLIRVEALARTGGFRQVLIPDKLLIAELALQGPTVRVPELLWYRRPTARFAVGRQRRSIYPGGTPLRARMPWPLAHSASLAWSIGVRGSLAPHVHRRDGPRIGALYLAANLRAIAEKRARRLRKTARGTASRTGRLGRRAAGRLRRHAAGLRPGEGR